MAVKELTQEERKRINEKFRFPKEYGSTREYKKTASERALGILKRIGEADEVYEDVLKILNDLNKPQDSEEYMNSRDTILKVIQTRYPSLTSEDIKGIKFFGGDKSELKDKFGMEVYPLTLVVPDEIWYPYYAVNPDSGILGVTPRQGKRMLESHGISSEQDFVDYMDGKRPLDDGKGYGEEGTVWYKFIKKGGDLMEKLGVPYTEEGWTEGVSFAVSDSPEVYPFNKLRSINIMSEGDATRHEDAHMAWVMYHGERGGMLDELNARRTDVLTRKFTWDKVKKQLRHSDYVRQETDRLDGLMESSENLDKRFEYSMEAYEVRGSDVVDKSVDTVAYLDKHLPRRVVSHILLNTRTLSELVKMPEKLILGEIFAREFKGSLDEEAWGEIKKKFTGEGSTPEGVELGPNTTEGISRIEELLKDKIGWAKASVDELRKDWTRPDITNILMDCETLNNLILLDDSKYKTTS